ncbi:MAG: hypothetical protein M3015_10900 [Bacteroidota bacterium]|nr:hypothetical protein [Bacteroidota bacterium]
MEDKVNKHTFLEFAEQQLEEHIAELNTQYEGRSMDSDEEKKTAIETHFNMFTAELEEKSKELGDEENDKQTIKDYQEKFKKALP